MPGPDLTSMGRPSAPLSSTSACRAAGYRGALEVVALERKLFTYVSMATPRADRLATSEGHEG